ncbi:MFS transporter [Agrobacterium vaccinii]|uniref:MFS transporter n=1 Tax=Agrobacterium vaccinii TaxID=2735528 RepID=UPI001E5CE8E2|nr:MFS transporter [Agrobacterium vaccinii]UHS61292.1 MFS transporter [Agrobacterium vaccinii]
MVVSTSSRSSWLAVLSLATGTFALVTTEFLPIGLLSDIANDFAKSPGSTGILVTTPGIVAAIVAPLCTVFAGSIDRRLLLVSFTLLLVLSNLIVATSSSFEMAITGRALLGVSVGGFWTFAAAVGRRLVETHQGNRAISVVMTGISVGTVVGVPLGSALGGLLGWRSAFIAVAALCLSVLLFQVAVLPKITMTTSQSFKGLADTIRDRKLVIAFAAIALAACGHFTAYTYLEPHLVHDVGADTTTLGWMLAIFGAAGIVGTFIGERVASRNPPAGTSLVALIMAASILMSILVVSNLLYEAIAVALWGAAFGAIPVCVQLWTFTAYPDRFETSSALMVTVFQIALAAGSLVGGLLTDTWGIPAAFMAATAFGIICSLLSISASLKTFTRSQEI